MTIINRTCHDAEIRAQAIAEVRIPAAIDALETARDYMRHIPVTYDVNGQCLYQAMDDAKNAIAKLECMRVQCNERVRMIG